MKRQLGAFLLMPLAILALSMAYAAADTKQGTVTISPPIQKLSLRSGLLQATSTVTITNSTSYNLAVHIKFVDFLPFGQQNGSIVLNPGTGQYAQAGLAKWMSLGGPDLIGLAAGKSQDVPVLINNTRDLTPGGHYGAVEFSTEIVDQANSIHVNFNQQLLSLYFVNKLGGDVAGLSLESLTADSNGDVPKTASLGLKSTGNVYVVPRGYVEVTNGAGKLVAKGILNPESSLIPQGSTRTFATLLQPVAGASTKGRLKLTAYYRYDGKDTYDSKSIYLNNGFPVAIVVVTGVISIILLALGYHLFVRDRRPHKRFR